MLHLTSLLGLFIIIAIAFGLSEKRSAILWKPVAGAVGLALGIGALVFITPASGTFFLLLNNAVVKLLDLSREGTMFVFGALALPPGEIGPAGEQSLGFFLAFQVFPAVIFFSALMSLLYYLHCVQPIVSFFARIFKRTMRLSGAEAMSSSSNIFVGIEAVFTIRPFLPKLTRSELFVLITCTMATTASTTLAIYVSFLKHQIPTIAGHLISASIITIPAAIAIAKLMIPETGEPETMGTLPPQAASPYSNLMGSVVDGAWEGMKLAAGIATLLIAVLGLVAMVNFALAKVGAMLPGHPSLSLQSLLGLAMIPFAWCLGIPSHDIVPAAQLLGERFILTEVVAYKDLATYAASGLISSPRTVLIMSYALCGFVHLASMAIVIGGISALIPQRRDELANLGMKALIASFLATILCGCVAGIFN